MRVSNVGVMISVQPGYLYVYLTDGICSCIWNLLSKVLVSVCIEAKSKGERERGGQSGAFSARVIVRQPASGSGDSPTTRTGGEFSQARMRYNIRRP